MQYVAVKSAKVKKIENLSHCNGGNERGSTFRFDYRASEIVHQSEERAIANLPLNLDYSDLYDGTYRRLLPSVQNAETT